MGEHRVVGLWLVPLATQTLPQDKGHNGLPRERRQLITSCLFCFSFLSYENFKCYIFIFYCKVSSPHIQLLRLPIAVSLTPYQITYPIPHCNSSYSLLYHFFTYITTHSTFQLFSSITEPLSPYLFMPYSLLPSFLFLPIPLSPSITTLPIPLISYS